MEAAAGTKIKVLIVDDHQVVRQGLRTFLDLHDDIEVVGEAGDGEIAIQLAAKLLPDVILMDLVMPRLDGMAAMSRIKASGAAVRIIALTSFAEDDKIIPAIRAGAAGYLLKDVSPDALVDTIRAVQRGESHLHPAVAHRLMEQVAGEAAKAPAAVALLTPRELEVIRLVGQGRTNSEIAELLVISQKTAKTHISNILGKLELQDRTQMAIYAIRNGLVDSGKA